MRCLDDQIKQKERKSESLKIEAMRQLVVLKYTPDFCGKDFIIETKGRQDKLFNLRWNLFVRHKAANDDMRPLYMPKNKKECEEVVRLILENRK